MVSWCFTRISERRPWTCSSRFWTDSCNLSIVSLALTKSFLLSSLARFKKLFYFCMVLNLVSSSGWSVADCASWGAGILYLAFISVLAPLPRGDGLFGNCSLNVVPIGLWLILVIFNGFSTMSLAEMVDIFNFSVDFCSLTTIDCAGLLAADSNVGKVYSGAFWIIEVCDTSVVSGFTTYVSFAIG